MKKVLFFMLFCLAITTIMAQTLKPNDAKSKIAFTIKNIGLNVEGTFKGLSGTINFDNAKPAASNFTVSIAAATINTGNNTRDGHLKKEEYFDVKKFPSISFQSQNIAAASNGSYTVTGVLTIKGKSKTITFPFTAAKLGNGWQLAANFTINRRDFKVGGNSLLLADDVKIKLFVVAQ
jgi:polyisoprenoid-binding protein YceI